MNTIVSFGVHQNQIKNTSKPKTATSSIQKEKAINKKKLAVGIMTGAGISALVVGGLLYKQKLDSTKFTKLAENIEFKPAQTIEEAIAFGKQNLGIKKYKGFNSDDIKIINWVNEGMTNASNKGKGKFVMPQKVQLYQGKIPNGGDAPMAANQLREMVISKERLKENFEAMKDFLKETKYTDKTQEEVGELVEKLSYQEVSEKVARIFKKKYGAEPATTKEFSIIYHELGHLQHFFSPDIPKIHLQLGNAEEIKEWNMKITPEAQKLRDLFDSSIEQIKDVSFYAKSSALEFVAEVFSYLCDDEKLSKETLDLYQKLGGAMI